MKFVQLGTQIKTQCKKRKYTKIHKKYIMKYITGVGALVLIAQTVFLLERVQTDRQTDRQTPRRYSVSCPRRRLPPAWTVADVVTNVYFCCVKYSLWPVLHHTRLTAECSDVERDMQRLVGLANRRPFLNNKLGCRAIAEGPRDAPRHLMILLT